jgi:hypothetical protein
MNVIQPSVKGADPQSTVAIAKQCGGLNVLRQARNRKWLDRGVGDLPDSFGSGNQNRASCGFA